MREFDVIQRFFTRPTPGSVLGVGDDAALLRVNDAMQLAVSSDMLVCGTHFFPDADPLLLGHKTLAVNLSDLAAMGALPRWAVLSLSLPQVDEAWLEKFSAGFFALADEHGVELVGGDTTRGELNLCVTIMGEVPQGKALRRDGAQLDDDIWVSGSLGNAALGLAHLQGKINLPDAGRADSLAALHQPRPRVALGLALRGIAHSAIDISDGLLADLGHILQRSQAGADIHFADIPSFSRGNHDDTHERLLAHCVLSGGDDYELCFTASARQRAAIAGIAAQLDLPLTRIGKIVAGCECVVRDGQGNPINVEAEGYDHFR